jgi:hypothetical protein
MPTAAFGQTDVPEQYQSAIIAASARWGVPTALLAAQINQESGFNPNALSPDGAIGIAQFMPGTAASVGLDPHDPMASIDAMAKLMSHYNKEFGSWEKALIAYHDGPNDIDDPGPAARNYVTKIMAVVGDALGIASNAQNPLVPDSLEDTTAVLKKLSDPEFWKRVGLGAAGFLAVLAGVFFLFGASPKDVGKAVVTGGGSVVKD